MKTKTILFSLFLMFTLQSSGQYIPLLDSSSWNIQISTQIGPQYVWIDPGVDVNIGPYTYKKFIDIDYLHTEIFVREDITAKKVYRRLNDADVLLFDFSLQIGNSVMLGNGNIYTVNNITNIDVNGGQRRMFSLVNPSPFVMGELWIEGVGNRSHPLKPNYELPSDPAYHILCSYQNGAGVYNFGLANGGTATVCPPPLSIESQSFAMQNIKVSPNPFSSETTITFEKNSGSLTIEIYNLVGQKVRVITATNSNEIILNREQLVDGIYFITFLQDTTPIETKKIVIGN
jgi:type IX secretion system substrate protein